MRAKLPARGAIAAMMTEENERGAPEEATSWELVPIEAQGVAGFLERACVVTRRFLGIPRGWQVDDEGTN
jgi:hypothetical protein